MKSLPSAVLDPEVSLHGDQAPITVTKPQSSPVPRNLQGSSPTSTLAAGQPSGTLGFRWGPLSGGVMENHTTVDQEGV